MQLYVDNICRDKKKKNGEFYQKKHPRILQPSPSAPLVALHQLCPQLQLNLEAS